ncbi:MAG: hypothetical protein DLM65_01715 [Candidatus Aeolococcus gillhamiae]|uniref:DUF4352 domain-containing protein n=1 Tax=Candidatus Aeolococcus gillhamiae TaxID=3127015 RepID=A0A2W6AIR1_9BACT|nr:MAG: hypothetical protein DLM65_01715 [Candidatus Dormibacter sp. RRmetagenome_bin12]
MNMYSILLTVGSLAVVTATVVAVALLVSRHPHVRGRATQLRRALTRRSRVWTRPGAVAVFVAMTAAACGSNEVSPAGPSSSPPTAGVTTVAKGRFMTASNGEAVRITSAAAIAPSATATSPLPAGKQCFAVNVSLKNGTQLDWSQPLTQMTVLDSSGVQSKANNGLGICPASATGGLDGVAAGDQTTIAQMIFLVPSTGQLIFNWTPTRTGEVPHQTPTLLGDVYQSPLR